MNSAIFGDYTIFTTLVIVLTAITLENAAAESTAAYSNCCGCPSQLDYLARRSSFGDTFVVPWPDATFMFAIAIAAVTATALTASAVSGEAVVRKGGFGWATIGSLLRTMKAMGAFARESAKPEAEARAKAWCS